jgi:integrase
MAKPYKLPSGRWHIKVQIAKSRYEFTGTKQECYQFEAEKRGKLDPASIYDHKTTFEEFLLSWYESHKTRIRANTRTSYQVAMQRYILPNLGRYKLREITPSRLQATYDRLHAEGVGASVLKIANAVVSGCLSHAERLELVGKNAAKLVIVPEPADRQETIWNEGQVSHFLAYVQGERNEMLYRLAFATGMRRNELLGLRWADVDWLNGAIRVHQQLHETKGPGFSWAPVKSRTRNIQLGVGLLSCLREQAEIVEAQRRLARSRWQEYDALFPSETGQPMTGNCLSLGFNRLELAAGLPRIRFHDIRHTYASIALMRNIPPATVAYILGDSLATLLRTYAHYIPGYQEQSAMLMDEVAITTRVDELV